MHHLDDAERMRVRSGLLGASVASIRSLEVFKEGPELYRAEIERDPSRETFRSC